MDFGSIISGAFGWLGAEQQNRRAADAAEQAQGFSAQQFASRYQTTVSDMKAAGLNPMLAYSQGGGSPPSGVQAPVVNSGAASTANYFQNKVASAQVANVEADTANKQASADLIKGQAAQAWASAGQANASVGQINATVDKIRQEIENMPKGDVNGHSVADWAKIIMAKSAGLLEAQTGQSQSAGWLSDSQVSLNEVQKRNLEAVISKLVVDTDLSKLDLSAAKNMGNLGREAGQLKPVIDILVQLILKGR